MVNVEIERGVTMVQRLFVYGTLAPNRPNEHILKPVKGEWQPAYISGTLVEAGWGAEMGYPAVIPSVDGSDGEKVEGFVFSSDELDKHWAMLDEFEGDGYERVEVVAFVEDGKKLIAQVYAIKQ